MKEYLQIPTYDECLAIKKDHNAFSYSKQEHNGFLVESFKYNLAMTDMWAGYGRLNMRGITFINGKLVALPFPKFFNYREKVEQVSFNNELDSPVKDIFEKVDGSLISVFRYPTGELDVKSMKSIYSDIAVEARAYLDTRGDVYDYSFDLLHKGLSPMFEYVSPTARIVLNYEKDFKFLGCRDMSTGEIILPNKLDVPASITVPMTFDNMDDATEYVNSSGVEGVVTTLESGKMIKMKSQEYCNIHRIISNFTKKNILESILNNTYDDAISIIKQNNLDEFEEKAEEYQRVFWKRYKETDTVLSQFVNENKDKPRKDVAQFLFKNALLKKYQKVIFYKLDGKDTFEALGKIIKDDLLIDE